MCLLLLGVPDATHVMVCCPPAGHSLTRMDLLFTVWKSTYSGEALNIWKVQSGSGEIGKRETYVGHQMQESRLGPHLLYLLIPCEETGTNWPTIDGNIYPHIQCM